VLDRRVTFDTKEKESSRDATERLMVEVLKDNPYDDSIALEGAFDRRGSPRPFEGGVSATNETVLVVLNRLICLDDHAGRRRYWHLLRRPALKGKKPSMLLARDVAPSSDSDIDRFIVSHTTRPIADALQIVAKDLGRPIGHEEPELKDTGCILRVDGKPHGPAGEFLGFSYSSSWTADKILDAMLHSFYLGGCNFAMLKSDEVLCVVPKARVIDLRLKTYADYHPISFTPVAFSADKRNATAVLSEVCEQVGKASGKTVVLSPRTVELLQNTQASFRSEGLPCWIALSKYLRTASQSLNWTLLHDPASDRYTLDVYDTTRPPTVIGTGK